MCDNSLPGWVILLIIIGILLIILPWIIGLCKYIKLRKEYNSK